MPRLTKETPDLLVYVRMFDVLGTNWETVLQH